MAALTLLLLLLVVAQRFCASRVRRQRDRMMRPGTEWDAEDVDRWLALIEPPELPLRPRERRRR
ncbi:MAG: hypothetical protein HC813_03015 [Planctomycetes bacterium]|nr:hypothetical protein [Planctomycetota bacterium]